MEYPQYRLLSYGRLYSFVERYMKSFNKEGFNAVSLEGVGNRVYSNYGRNGVSKFEAVNEIVRTLEYVSGQNEIMLDQAGSYAVGYAGVSVMTPESSSRYMVFERCVPFYQIALRGLINLSTRPANFSGNPRGLLLKCYETGMIPLYTFIGEDTSVLNNSSLTNLYAASYSDWKDGYLDAMLEYKEFSGLVKGCAIVSHAALSGDVSLTVYENGIMVYVNYGGAPFSVSDGVAVPAMGYLLDKK